MLKILLLGSIMLGLRAQDPVTVCDGGDDCCDNVTCGLKEGDCDSHEDCVGHLRCGVDNCDGPGFDATDDCCEEDPAFPPPFPKEDLEKCEIAEDLEKKIAQAAVAQGCDLPKGRPESKISLNECAQVSCSADLMGKSFTCNNQNKERTCKELLSLLDAMVMKTATQCSQVLRSVTCTSDSDCTGQQTCSTKGSCSLSCDSDVSVCANDKPYCSGTTCVKCTADSHCRDATKPVCHSTDHECVECEDDNDCTTGDEKDCNSSNKCECEDTDCGNGWSSNALTCDSAKVNCGYPLATADHCTDCDQFSTFAAYPTCSTADANQPNGDLVDSNYFKWANCKIGNYLFIHDMNNHTMVPGNVKRRSFFQWAWYGHLVKGDKCYVTSCKSPSTASGCTAGCYNNPSNTVQCGSSFKTCGWVMDQMGACLNYRNSTTVTSNCPSLYSFMPSSEA